MVPLEMVTLYVPFVVCWFFIWLTSVAERTKIELSSRKENQELPKCDHHQTHHRQHIHHWKNEDRLLLWNVSSFFGLNGSAK